MIFLPRIQDNRYEVNWRIFLTWFEVCAWLYYKGDEVGFWSNFKEIRCWPMSCLLLQLANWRAWLVCILSKCIMFEILFYFLGLILWLFLHGYLSLVFLHQRWLVWLKLLNIETESYIFVCAFQLRNRLISRIKHTTLEQGIAWSDVYWTITKLKANVGVSLNQLGWISRQALSMSSCSIIFKKFRSFRTIASNVNFSHPYYPQPLPYNSF